MPLIKLDRYSIMEIKELIEENELTNSQIGEKFGVSRRHINHIRLNKRWIYCHLCEQEINKQKQIQINVQLQETQSDSSATPSYRITI